MSNTQSHLIVTEEGLKIYKDDPASAILCEDQERAWQLIVEHHFVSSGHLVAPAFNFPYPVPGIEFDEWYYMPALNKWVNPKKEVFNKSDCTKTVARLIEHTEEKEESLQEMGYTEQVWQWYSTVINKWVDVTFEEWDHMKSKGKNPKHLRTIFKPITPVKSESPEIDKEEKKPEKIFTKYLDKFRFGIFRSSLDSYLETGKLSGSLFLDVREMFKEWDTPCLTEIEEEVIDIFPEFTDDEIIMKFIRENYPKGSKVKITITKLKP